MRRYLVRRFLLAVPTLAGIVLSVFLLMLHDKTAKLYGGRAKLFVSSLGELIFSVLFAPVMMLLHTLFVFSILLGANVDPFGGLIK